jgi:hypothetical protein
LGIFPSFPSVASNVGNEILAKTFLNDDNFVVSLEF